MEIRDYLRVHRRRLLWLLLLPLVAGGVTVAGTLSRPQSYSGSAVVTLPPPLVESAGALQRFAEDFEQAVTSAAVLDRTAAATGVPRRELRTGLVARRLGSGAQLRVSTVGEDPDEVAEVLRTAATQTLVALAEPGVEIARLAVGPLQARFDEANARLNEFYARTGLLTPTQRFQSLSDEIGDLGNSAAAAAAEGDTERVARLRASQQRKQADLDAISPLVNEYRVLNAAVTDARGPLQSAERDVREAELVLTASTLPSAISAVDVNPVSTARLATRAAAIAAGLALFLGAGLLVLLDLLTGPSARRATRRAPAGSEPESAAAGSRTGGAPRVGSAPLGSAAPLYEVPGRRGSVPLAADRRR